MENALRACCKGIKIGKILIHGDGKNGRQVGGATEVSYLSYNSHILFNNAAAKITAVDL